MAENCYNLMKKGLILLIKYFVSSIDIKNIRNNVF